MMFQSTPPERGATGSGNNDLQVTQVSIHAPREGSDGAFLLRPRSSPCFNPRPPRGERPPRKNYWPMFRRFQSTPPERGATTVEAKELANRLVSIHAPREGSDGSPGASPGLGICFNPRPPRGERHYDGGTLQGRGLFQSTPPERGATIRLFPKHKVYVVSIHAPREGSDSIYSIIVL